MAKITCDVVKDLLPLYVDDVLSGDSRALVEEHLKTCDECADLCKNLKGDDNFALTKNENDKAAIKRIKKKIQTKRIVTALVSALCIAAIAFGTYYGLHIKESYIPFDESGLRVNGDSLQTDRDFYASYGRYTPDGKTCFIYMTTTAYKTMWGEDRLTTIEDLSDEGRGIKIDSDDDGITDSVLVNSEIYYVSEEYAKQMSHGKWDFRTDEDIEMIKQNSVLVWSAE